MVFLELVFRLNLNCKEVKRLKMGNKIARISSIIVGSKEIPTPEMKNLSERQIEIIKKSWAIPYAKVRF